MEKSFWCTLRQDSSLALLISKNFSDFEWPDSSHHFQFWIWALNGFGIFIHFHALILNLHFIFQTHRNLVYLVYCIGSLWIVCLESYIRLFGWYKSLVDTLCTCRNHASIPLRTRTKGQEKNLVAQNFLIGNIMKPIKPFWKEKSNHQDSFITTGFHHSGCWMVSPNCLKTLVGETYYFSMLRPLSALLVSYLHPWVVKMMRKQANFKFLACHLMSLFKMWTPSWELLGKILTFAPSHTRASLKMMFFGMKSQMSHLSHWVEI